MGEVILLASGKGGTGQTVLAANLGSALALRGERVLLADFNQGLRNLDICMGLESHLLFDILDILKGVCTIDKALTWDDRFPSLALISAPQGRVSGCIFEHGIATLFAEFKKMFRYIIIDAPRSLGKDIRLLAREASKAIIVTTQDYGSLRNCQVIDALLAEEGLSNRSFVLNMVRSDIFGKGIVPEMDEAAGMLRLPMLGVLPYDDNIFISSSCGYPIVCKKDSYISDTFFSIVNRLCLGVEIKGL